ncbi:MAG TPA: carbohydrate kinase family protein [Devosia sp.]|nr:carbohydrate kinase family protein [Devosia sp.]
MAPVLPRAEGRRTASADPAPAVLVVGDVMTDIICRPEGPLILGSDRRAEIRARPGGSGANQAVWLASFGARVRFAGRVGAADRDALAAHFAGLGVEAVLGADPLRPSGAIVTIVSPDGERSFLTDRGANAFLSAGDLPPALLADVGLLVVSGYALFEPGPRAAVSALMAAARQAGIGIAVDPASVGFLEEVGPGNFLDWTEGATMIFANDAEALALTGETDAEAQLAALLGRYSRAAVKRGGLGAVFGSRDGERCLRSAPQVDVVDSTGAGDAFAAAFIAAELGGAAAATALERAVAAGSAAVRQIGGRPPVTAG